MESMDRLQLLSEQMDLEPAEDAGCPKLAARPSNDPKAPNISSAVLPNGKRIALLKTLLTSSCERNCYYCPFRAGRNFRRATFKPEEMAKTYHALNQAGIAEGIFLSSGVAGGSIRTQDRLIATAEILRAKYHYRGYLHLKLMPGAERDQIERAMQLSNRVSVNLEAPNTQRLERLAPKKGFMEELLQPLKWVEEIRRSRPSFVSWNGRWPSMTTQFVVGPAGESDLELLTTTSYLYRRLNLSRAYFSAFRPILDTPFENLPAEDPLRQNRLYQASFLLRDYGFDLEELPFDAAGRLPINIDPKIAWAQSHLMENPVEINQASIIELLRIPGIGPRGARAILNARSQGKICSLAELRKIGVNPDRAVPFILLAGFQPARQLTMW
jgi:predicted DNA-binding helix-hairpin-helix protein